MSIVQWREWNDETFRLAQSLDKPILLDIGAVWCHWCHVMDDGIPGDPIHTGTYSDTDVALLIHEHYIPIKVDNDRRPDINARYNMGGWPTTVFLTPTGEPLYGETYVTPKRMIGLLNYVAGYYRDHKGDIAVRLAEHVDDEANSPSAAAEVPADAPSKIAAAIVESYDSQYGGFGTEPKFPHIRALEFAVEQAEATDWDLGGIANHTLNAMAGGGTYDQFAGGFFRYSTTRDWRIPHYEKMLEDNTQLSALCFKAAALLDDEHLAEIGRDVHQWLFNVMRDSETGTFAGSQDADKEDEYYGQPIDKRAEMPTPYIDRTVYLGWNAYMVSSLVARFKLDGDAAILEPARQLFDFLQSRVAPYHYFVDGQPQGTVNLLADLTALIAAALDLHDVTAEGEILHAARGWANHILAHLTDPAGGFYDFAPDPNAIGALAKPKVDMNESADSAIALVRLSVATGDAVYRNTAASAVKRFAAGFERWSFFGAAYGRAVAALLAPEVEVVIAGNSSHPGMVDMRHAAWQRFSHTLRVTADTTGARYPAGPDGAPLAYVCVGTTCQAPVADASALRETLARVLTH
ncbi:MAG TPA: DUF255 domain-containing protein [Capsulimonadaceae bacterium]|jgi:hypothetical protein